MHVESVPEYLNVIKAFGHEEANGLVSWHADSAFVYRGLNDEGNKLIPGIYRKMRQKGYETEDKYRAGEKEVLKHFIQEASVYNDNIPAEDRYRWVQVAQHYGAPTRLLDWTNNPLIALFFACERNAKKDGVVWILHKKRYYDFSTRNEKKKESPQEMLQKILSDKKYNGAPEYPFLFTPYYFDQRMSAQSSWFMAWGRNPKCLDELLEGKTLELPEKPVDEILKQEIKTHEIIDNFFKKECIAKVIIKGEDKDLIIEELNSIGINEKSLFPGMDGVGRYIEHRYNQDER